MGKRRRIINKTDLLSVLGAFVYVLLTAFLFFDFELVSIVSLSVIPLIIIRFRKDRAEKQKWTMCIQFNDALMFLKNGLDAGYSPERSLIEATASLEKLYGKNAEITKGFYKMKSRIDTGFTMEQALIEFADETKVSEIAEFSELFSVLKRTGGDMNSVIKRTSFNLREKIELRREISVLVAAKRNEFRIMCVMPYAILLYLKLFASEMTAALYHNLTGIVFMIIMLALYWGCFLAGDYILRSRLTL